MFTHKKTLLLRSTALILTSAAALAVMGSSAFAAEQATAPTAQAASAAGAAPEAALPEIVVTAERRSENLQKTPVAAAAIGAAGLEQAGVQNFEDISKMTPSLSIITQPGGTNFINIRGVGVGVATPFQSAGVPLMVDGLYLPNSQNFITNAYFDLSNVELYRGPQGTFAGQNSTGGALFVNSKQPDFNGFSGYAQQLIGSYGWYQTQAAANLPISDTLAARFAINAEQRDGWTKNYGSLNPAEKGLIGQDATHNPGNLDNLDLRFIVRWKPSDKVDIRLRYDHQTDNSNGSPDLNTSPAPAGSIYNTTNSVGNIPSPRAVAYDYNGYSIFDVDRVTLNGDFHLTDGIELKSITGYQKLTTKSQQEGDFGSPYTSLYGSTGLNPGVNQSIGVVNSVDTYYSQEFDILSTYSGPLQWVAGADYYHQTTPLHNGSITYATNPNQPNGGALLNYYQSDFSYAVFGEVRYNFTDQLQAIIGGRWTDYQINLNQGSDFTPFVPPANAFVNILNESAVATYKEPTGRAVLNWFATPTTTVYGGVSTGFKQGGYVTQLDQGPGQHPGYSPELITDYEGGVKTTTLDGHLRLDVDGYYENYRDYQAAFVLPTALVPLTQNIGNARVYGFEGTADWIWDALKISAVFGYNNTRTTSNSNIGQIPAGEYGPGSPPPPSGTAPVVACPASLGSKLLCSNFVGEVLNYAPEWTANLTVQYDFHVLNGTLTPWAQLSYQDSQWATLFHAPQDFIPAFTTLDVRLAYKAADHWRIEGFATNVTNKTYIAGVSGGTLGVGPSVVLGAPRIFGVRLKYTY